MLLKFRLTDDGFTFANPADLIAAASIDYIKCHFDITAKSWKDTDAVVAVFKSATYNRHAEVLLDSNNNCVIDPQIYKRGGRIQVKLIGDRYINESVIGSTNITSILEFDVKENIIIPIQTPSKYDVFVAELEKAEKAVEDVITDLTTRAERGDFDGADGVGISTVVYNSDDTVTITLADGTEFTSDHSLKGEKGDPGTPGDSIANIAYGQDGTVTITLASGTTFTSEYSMKGEKGDKGEPGDIPDIQVNGSSVISDDIANIVNTDLGIGYGYCETASNTTTKVVTLDGFKLVDGAIVTVLFKYAAPRIWKLNINGTGAKNVTKNAMAASGSSGMAFPELADTNIDHPVATFMYSASKNSYAFLGAAYMTASASRDGLMSASDKTKLDSTPSDVLSRGDIVVLEGTITDIPANDHSSMHHSKDELADTYGITNLDDWSVISSEVHWSGGANWRITDPVQHPIWVGLYAQSTTGSTAVTVSITNNHSSAADFDYRVVLMRVK